MTVFIAHAEADREVAEALGKFLERRGLFVELENGERGFRHAQPTDTVAALWSKDTVFSPHRLAFERRTMEAWADEQLAMVKLDHAFSPVGLRDMKAIDASFEAQRDIAWSAVAKLAQDARTRPRPQASDGGPPPMSAPAPGGAPAPQRKAPPPASANASGLLIMFIPLVLLLIGAGLYALATMRPDVIAALPPNAYQMVLPFAGAFGALVLIGVFLASRRKPSAAGAPESAATTGETLFVSYAHADNTAVLPVVEAVQAQGRAVWLDKGGISAGEGWAGEIVRAIKAAGGVIVMCSRQAFESDHVKREVYLADRYKKRLVPVFIEAADPPEDFEYFFASVQWLELHKTPESERPAAIARALKAV